MLNEMAIRCFLSLANTLNFTETAKNMYMTQQSVSKYIAKLEESLGFKLFIRTHHYVAITKAGENFYELFSKFMADYARVTEETRRYYSDMYNTIRIGYLEMLEITSQLSGALKVLKDDFPDIRPVGEKHPQHELIELFMNRKLDLIITYREFAPRATGVKKAKVLETPLVLLVSPDHPKVREGATVADFKGDPFIKAAASHETGTETRNRALRQCRELGFTPSEIIIAPNIESAYMATELGQGVFVSTMLSRMSLHSELICYPIGKNEELQCFWFENQENPAVAKFASCIESKYDGGEDGRP
ncbi:MAG: LysR family transcriptional regulator [Oscillospiraceae bacterium]|nr:LysR family transcriptional regulator [Oscillospiraceae bacterium]